VAVNPFWVDLDRYQPEPGASVARAITVRNVVTNRSGTDPRKFDIGSSVPQEVLNGPLVALRYEMIAALAWLRILLHLVLLRFLLSASKALVGSIIRPVREPIS
jgi:hypothetical protein